MGRNLSTIGALTEPRRLALMASGVSNLWLVVLFSRAMGTGEPATEELQALSTPLALLLAAGVTLGLHVFGLTLNDVLDSRHDRLFEPKRQRGVGPARVKQMTLILTPAALLVAMLCALPFGTTAAVICLICATGVLFYDAAGKYLPAAGILSLGLVRAGQMFVVNPDLAFCWPVWLVLAHIVGVNAAAYVLGHKRPRLTGSHLWWLVGGWVFAALVLVVWMTSRQGLIPHKPWLWVGPLAATGVFALLATWRLRRLKRGRDAGRALSRLGWQWLMVYDVVWLGGAELWWQAGVVAGLAVVLWGGMAVAAQRRSD